MKISEVKEEYNKIYSFCVKASSILKEAGKEDERIKVAVESISKCVTHLEDSAKEPILLEAKWVFLEAFARDAADYSMLAIMRNNLDMEDIVSEYHALPNGEDVKKLQDETLKPLEEEQEDLKERNKIYEDKRTDFAMFQNVAMGRVGSFEEAEKQLEAQRENAAKQVM